jgi:hypothetical protein
VSAFSRAPLSVRTIGVITKSDLTPVGGEEEVLAVLQERAVCDAAVSNHHNLFDRKYQMRLNTYDDIHGYLIIKLLFPFLLC